MKPIFEDIGTYLVRELKRSTRVCAVVAYFTPCDRTLAALDAIADLRLVVSDEFTINNPRKLHRLSKADIRVVATDDPAGKLHAKVLVGERADTSTWALLGSANLTYSGLFANREAVVLLESSCPEDQEAIDAIQAWATEAHRSAGEPDWEAAENTFERARNAGREKRRKSTIHSSRRYWILKTTAGPAGRSYWSEFKAEGVLAVGWRVGCRDLSTLSQDEVRSQLLAEGVDEARASSKIIRFAQSMQVGDRVVICGGYPPTSKADVHVYGVAEVEGDYFPDPRSSWWCHKLPVDIQVMEENLSRPAVAAALNRDSLLETVHEISESEFEAFCDVLLDQAGIAVRS